MIFLQGNSMDNETNEHIDFDKVKINYVLPFSNHDNGGLMAIAVLYAFLFMLGTCGNAAILAVVYHVRSSDPRARQNTTLTYICVLSIVDFASMLPLPMTIIDQVLGFWMFGTVACKLFRLFEHIGKIFSTFILVCFSIDRYCAVCHPLKVELRNTKTAYSMLAIMFCITCAMLCPIVIFTQSTEIIVHEKYNKEANEITRLHLFKCVDNLGNELFILFSLSCFFFSLSFSSLFPLWMCLIEESSCDQWSLAYLVPLLMMIYFYYAMLMKLFKQNRRARKAANACRPGKCIAEDKIPVTRIATYTLVICLFHFVCWTPYWVSVLYSLYLEIFPPPEFQMPGSSFIYFMYGVHALPYINSASNFILYGLLNRQLHRLNPRKRSRLASLNASQKLINQPKLQANTIETVSNGRTEERGKESPKISVTSFLRCTNNSNDQNANSEEKTTTNTNEQNMDEQTIPFITSFTSFGNNNSIARKQSSDWSTTLLTETTMDLVTTNSNDALNDVKL